MWFDERELFVEIRRPHPFVSQGVYQLACDAFYHYGVRQLVSDGVQPMIS